MCVLMATEEQTNIMNKLDETFNGQMRTFLQNHRDRPGKKDEKHKFTTERNVRSVDKEVNIL